MAPMPKMARTEQTLLSLEKLVRTVTLEKLATKVELVMQAKMAKPEQTVKMD